jgi:hypothetical protein
LEFLMDRGEKEAVFHNELVFNYLDTIIKLKQDPSYKSSTTRHDTTRHDTTRHDTTRHDTTRHDPRP